LKACPQIPLCQNSLVIVRVVLHYPRELDAAR